MEATQSKPGSFYNVFASKKALFVRALEHYIDQVVSVRIAKHLNQQDPMKAIKDFFSPDSAELPKQKFIGCLLTNTATEIGKLDIEINKVVWAGLRKIQSALKRRLADAKKAGQVSPELNIEATALHLLSCYQGMGVIGRLTQDKTKLRSLSRSALQVLK